MPVKMKTIIGLEKFWTLFIAIGAVLACGIILMPWISLEWWIFGFNAICNVYFAFGLIETALAIVCLSRK